MPVEVLFAVDPGVRGCGVSKFENGILTWSDYVLSDDPNQTAVDTAQVIFGRSKHYEGYPNERRKTSCIIERPVIRRQAQQKGDQKDIADLLLVAGGIAGILRYNGIECRLTEPERWKGQVPKAIMLARIEQYLTKPELKKVPDLIKKLRHNVIDAIGLGLVAVRRLGPLKEIE